MKTVSKVIHLADIHIRLVKRHDEYRECFAKLIEDITPHVDSETVIVVAGDIVHAKLDLSPELVQLTSEFLKSLADVAPTYVISGNHDCFTGDHELLTPVGWKRLDDIVSSHIEYVMAYNDITGELQFEKVSNWIQKMYRGEMHHIVGKNIDMVVTSTHEIPYYHYSTGTIYKKIASELPITARIIGNGNANAPIRLDRWIELLGFICGDGTVVKKSEVSKCGRVQFRLKRPDTIEYCKSLLLDLNIKFTEMITPDGVTVIRFYGTPAKNVIDVLCGNTKNANFIYTAPTYQQYSFMVGFLAADGHEYKSNPNFYTVATVREDYKNILLTLPPLFGGVSHLHKSMGKGNFDNSKPQFLVSVNMNRYNRYYGISKHEVNLCEGMVYCVTVPSHNLLVRRNSKVFVSGNCNLSNKSRLDSLSPIIASLAHPDLTYWKHSGVYNVGDVQFLVYSILDEKDSWPSVPKNNKTKIGLYHGPIYGSQTATNFTITSRHTEVSQFDGLDIVILGDIHSYQQLQEYDKKAKTPAVVYSSSLIQQNHGESEDGHGWVLWNVKDRTHEFFELPNTYGYRTIDISDGTVPSNINMPKNVRLRVLTGDTDATQLDKLLTLIKTKHNIVETSISKGNVALSKFTRGATAVEVDKITQLPTQLELLKNWIEDHIPTCPESVLQQATDIHTELYTKLKLDDKSRNITWKPLKFSFSNMFSYGEGNVIHFDSMKGVWGVFAPNAAGKSSIMDAVMFCLYDKTPRAYKGDHIMNNRKTSFECELVFEINGECFTVTRKGKKNKAGEVKVDVDFFKTEADGTVVSLNGTERRFTNSNIRDFVGTYEDFVLTAFSSQNGASLFVDKTHSERKDLLCQFMGLDVFDQLHEMANEDSRDMAVMLKKYKAANVSDTLSDIQKKILELNNQLETVNILLQDNNFNVGVNQSKKEELLRQHILIHSAITDINKVQESRIKLGSALESGEDKLAEWQEKIALLSETASELERDINETNLENPNLYDSVQFYNKLCAERVDMDRKWMEITKYRTVHENKIAFLDTLKYNKDCSVCIDNNQKFIDDAENSADRILDLDSQLATINQEKEAADISIEQLKPLVSIYSELEERMSDLKYTKSEIMKATIQKQTVDSEIEKINAAIIKVDHEIEIYLKNQDAIVKNLKLDREIEDLDRDTENLLKSVREVQTLILSFEKSIAIAESKKIELVQEIDAIKACEEKVAAYNAYLAAVGRNGITHTFLAKAIPAIEDEINNILSQIVDFTVKLELDGKNINGIITYSDDRTWPLENGSGMERFISGLAIRVALMSASNLPKPTFLVIDEGLGTLDMDNLNNMIVFLDILQNQFELVILISHLDSARDMASEIIEITRDNGFSFIKS